MKKFFESETVKIIFRTFLEYIGPIMLGLFIGSMYNVHTNRIREVERQLVINYYIDEVEINALQSLFIRRKIDSLEYILDHIKTNPTEISIMTSEINSLDSADVEIWKNYSTALDSLKSKVDQQKEK